MKKIVLFMVISLITVSCALIPRFLRKGSEEIEPTQEKNQITLQEVTEVYFTTPTSESDFSRTNSGVTPEHLGIDFKCILVKLLDLGGGWIRYEMQCGIENKNSEPIYFGDTRENPFQSDKLYVRLDEFDSFAFTTDGNQYNAGVDIFMVNNYPSIPHFIPPGYLLTSISDDKLPIIRINFDLPETLQFSYVVINPGISTNQSNSTTPLELTMSDNVVESFRFPSQFKESNWPSRLQVTPFITVNIDEPVFHYTFDTSGEISDTYLNLKMSLNNSDKTQNQSPNLLINVVDDYGNIIPIVDDYGDIRTLDNSLINHPIGPGQTESNMISFFVDSENISSGKFHFAFNSDEQQLLTDMQVQNIKIDNCITAVKEEEEKYVDFEIASLPFLYTFTQSGQHIPYRFVFGTKIGRKYNIKVSSPSEDYMKIRIKDASGEQLILATEFNNFSFILPGYCDGFYSLIFDNSENTYDIEIIEE